MANNMDDKFKAWANGIRNTIKADLAESEARIMKAIGEPERITDRFLLWVRRRPHSWLLWPILVFTHAVAASVWKALG